MHAERERHTSVTIMTMDGIKGSCSGGADGGDAGAGEEDIGDIGMPCNNHPYGKNSGGICAFCLQEKLGKLFSSSSTSISLPPVRAASTPSSSSSPPFRSNIHGAVHTVINRASSSTSSSSTSTDRRYHHHHPYYTRRGRNNFSFLSSRKIITENSSSQYGVVFSRSKSTTSNPSKRNGFWSFLHLSFSKPEISRKVDRDPTPTAAAGVGGSAVMGGAIKRQDVIIEEDDSPNTGSASASSFERKVSRSRSVGCGSRSFSGDFFERISTGFGDCTLRRVESQREGKAKVGSSHHHGGGGVKERVRCGGLFSGFMLSASSSSSFSSTSADQDHVNGKPVQPGTTRPGPPGINGRNKSWRWAYASPMRPFSRPSSSSSKLSSSQVSDKNTAPNLSAIPSLLAAST